MKELSKDLVLVCVVNHMHFGGCQKIVYDLLTGLNSNFKSVYLIARKGYYSDEIIANTTVRFIDITGFNTFKVIKEIRKLQKKHDKLILHTHNRKDILYKFILRKRDSHLHTFHSAYLDKNFLYKYVKPQNAISISKTVKNYLSSHNIPSYLIYNGVDLKTIQYVHEKENIHAHRILYVGRVSEQKGFDNLFKALISFSIKHDKIKLDVIGSGEKIEQYNKFLTSNTNNIKVNFKGFLPNPWMEINNYDLLVIPSYFEGFCLVAVEAAAIGIPIIGNNILALREVLSFLPDSNFFDVYDENSIHQTIIGCLKNMEDQRRLALENTHVIKNKFSKEKMLKNYLKIYESL